VSEEMATIIQLYLVFLTVSILSIDTTTLDQHALCHHRLCGELNDAFRSRVA
jgi:hypothetical protein